MAHLEPKSILELGTGRSHSTLALALGAPKAFIQTIDLVNRRTGCRDLLRDRVAFVTGDIWGHTNDLIHPDLLFIDDDHHYHQVLRELVEFAPRTSRCIILHDTHIVRKDAEVRRALNDWFSLYNEDVNWKELWDCDYRPGITALIRK